MCGICGYYGLENKQEILKSMNTAQSHRGPDGEGYYEKGNVGLGHRRLAIIDRKGGAQPMISVNNSVAIVFNGEIYNFRELREELIQLGRAFKTHSDTEVVLQAYDEWGDDSFDRLNGMFAIAINDERRRRFVLVRDHFGIKPLYYAQKGTEKSPKVIFGSEIKSILASGQIKVEPNDNIIYRYLKFRIHDDGRDTFFKGISRLGAGEKLVIDSNGLEISSYTSLVETLKSAALRPGTSYTAKDAKKYRDLLIDSVKARLISEVPVGTSLSGGLDSSAVAVIINKLMKDDSSSTESIGRKQNTFSAVFPSHINDEERYVDEVAKVLESHVSMHKILPTADQFAEDLTDFIRTQEEPIISTGPYAQYQVMREARNHVTVLLDGQGADEMMAGYIPYYFVYLNQLKKQRKYLRLMFEVVNSAGILYRLGRFKIKDKLSFRPTLSSDTLLDNDFLAKHRGEKFTVVSDNLKLRLVEDIFKNSLPSLLRYEDKNTMRFSLEGRVPFLDKDVLPFIFSLSDEAIIKQGWNKRVLRDATKGLLPEMIRSRRNKIGFTTPETEWFMRLKNRFYYIFMSEEFASRPYFNQTEVLKAFEGFISGKNDANSMQFWRLINLELWLREFIDEKKEEVVTIKDDFEPNRDKKLDIEVDGREYRRYAVRTDIFAQDDDLNDKVSQHVKSFFARLSKQNTTHQSMAKNSWYLFISEKIVAITQGRSYFIGDINPRWSATFLSKFVSRNPYGIGLGSPWTMELAIREVGLPKIIFASIGGAVGKLVGKRGWFYILVGENVRAIDGPTEYSTYPSNVSAKLAPKDSDKVSEALTRALKDSLPSQYAETLRGVVVIDSNDIGRNILGHNTDLDEKTMEDIFGDNPLGQADERTPLAIVFEK